MISSACRSRKPGTHTPPDLLALRVPTRPPVVAPRGAPLPPPPALTGGQGHARAAPKGVGWVWVSGPSLPTVVGLRARPSRLENGW